MVSANLPLRSCNNNNNGMRAAHDADLPDMHGVVSGRKNPSLARSPHHRLSNSLARDELSARIRARTHTHMPRRNDRQLKAAAAAAASAKSIGSIDTFNLFKSTAITAF
jgi:hypothetical protein